MAYKLVKRKKAQGPYSIDEPALYTMDCWSAAPPYRMNKERPIDDRPSQSETSPYLTPTKE